MDWGRGWDRAFGGWKAGAWDVDVDVTLLELSRLCLGGQSYVS